MFDNNNNPKPEGWLAIAMAIAAGYYVINYKKPMKEIVFMEFYNDYLTKN